MREILFRAKRKDNGEWIFGSIVHQTDYYGDRCDRWFILEGDSTNDYDIDYPREVQKETVGQFTGLLDKNGTKIFEGDILSEPERPKYTTGAIYYGMCNCSCCYGVYGFYSEEDADLRDAAWLTVIGNIHDNPELLKGGGANG